MKPAPLYGNTYQNPLDARIAEEMESERDVVDLGRLDPEEAGREFQAVSKTAENDELLEPTLLKAPEGAEKEQTQEVDREKTGPIRQSRRLRKEKPENSGL